eukprot:TRINITY_DN21345_c0_g1_i1.p1 TRINITY_DN21345_c0_g1~~TRINITY_DN21345_c0_g1_i1.p1  ORF type:complete len:396 (+),score=66.28 TRINITY_DN21345_c0_g1_i1:67-1188(+)
MKILYITVEYHAQYSGNGTASISFIRSLRELGCEVFVVCGGLEADVNRFKEKGLCCQVSKWHIHGMTGPWEEWGKAVGERIIEFTPDVVIGVDWEANDAYKNLLLNNKTLKGVPYVYYNYRVYHQNTGCTDEETRFYLEKEKEACGLAGKVLCLCRSDKRALGKLTGKPITILLPGLRKEIWEAAEATETQQEDKIYLLCCVRVVVEKNVHVFVEAVEKIAELLRQRGIVPCMLGASDGKDYGEGVRKRMRSLPCKTVVKDFVPPDELAGLMRRSCLNVHPALNEAYGMTIVEAAAMGCPSLVHQCDIGATDLLTAPNEILLTDMSDSATLATTIVRVLNEPSLASIAQAACAKALSYGELENARSLRSAVSL